MQPESPSAHREFDPELVQHLEGIKSFSETYTESTLQRERAGKRLPQIIRKIYAITDQEMDRIRKAVEFVEGQGLGVSKVDCHEGCSSCCYWPVRATMPEVLAVGKFVDENFSDLEKSALLKRIAAYVPSETACPYLVDHMCSVYMARPLVCRQRSSRDVAVCVQVKEGTKSEAEVPVFPMFDAIGEAASTGLRKGLFFEATDNGFVELASASAAMFENPQLADQFLQGQNVLGSARIVLPGDSLEDANFAASAVPSYISDVSKSIPTGKLSAVDLDSLKPFNDLGLRQARYEEAFRSLVEDTPIHQMSKLTVPRVYRSEKEISEWREHYKSALESYDPSEYNSVLAFNALQADLPGLLSYHGVDDKDLLVEHGKLIGGIAQRAVPDLTSPIDPRKREGKLRVGYLSANVGNDSGTHWSLGWIRNHGEDIESFVFNVGFNLDDVSRDFRLAADHYFHLMRHVPENASFIKSLGLDVLIFTDLGTNGLNTVYSTMRLAPVQCTAWGTPETSGLDTIDYYITGELMEPSGAEKFYTEKLVKLPGSGICYPRFEVGLPSVGRSHFAISDSRPLLINVQAMPKLHPREDTLYAQIAAKANAPIIFVEGSNPGESTLVKKRMSKAGVRAQWLPPLSRSEFMALLKLADVAIDTVNSSGGVTTIQTLAVGTPVVTLPGSFRRGRQSAGFLTSCGAPGLVAKNEADFVALASDFDRQKKAATEMDANAIFDDVSPVLELDKFLRKVAS